MPLKMVDNLISGDQTQHNDCRRYSLLESSCRHALNVNLVLNVVLGITKEPEIMACIICDEKINSAEERIRYDVMCSKDNSWGIDIHRRLDCFNNGLVLLDGEIRETSCVESIRVTATIGGIDHKYGIERGMDDYGFATTKHSYWDHASDEMTFKFLKSYKADNALIFARISSLNSKTAYGIPKLMSKNDPEIPSGLLDDELYASRVKRAEKEYDMSMRIRGKSEIEEANILARYAKDTMIVI